MPATVVHFQIRLPPNLHERLSSLAQDEKTSLNLLVIAILERALKERSGASDRNRHDKA